MSIHHIGNDKGCKYKTFSYMPGQALYLQYVEKNTQGSICFYTTKQTIKIIKFQLLRFTVQKDQILNPAKILIFSLTINRKIKHLIYNLLEPTFRVIVIQILVQIIIFKKISIYIICAIIFGYDIIEHYIIYTKQGSTQHEKCCNEKV